LAVTQLILVLLAIASERYEISFIALWQHFNLSGERVGLSEYLKASELAMSSDTSFKRYHSLINTLINPAM
jgi:hypothetical protein